MTSIDATPTNRAPKENPLPVIQTNRDSKQFDVVVIGGGHNGLVCAAYLARASLKVKVLERRSVVGGAPGFRNSRASYTVSLRLLRVE